MLKECFLCEVLNKLVAEEIEAFHTANIQASICVWSWDTAVGLSSLEKTQVVMPKCRCRLSSVKAASRKSGREQEEMTARRAGVSRWESTPSDAPSAVTSWCVPAMRTKWGKTRCGDRKRPVFLTQTSVCWGSLGLPRPLPISSSDTPPLPPPRPPLAARIHVPAGRVRLSPLLCSAGCLRNFALRWEPYALTDAEVPICCSLRLPNELKFHAAKTFLTLLYLF